MPLWRPRHKGKKIVGRKRGIVTDTLGLLLAVIVTTAAASDNTIGIDLLDQAKAAHPDLAKTQGEGKVGVIMDGIGMRPGVEGFASDQPRYVPRFV